MIFILLSEGTVHCVFYHLCQLQRLVSRRLLYHNSDRATVRELTLFHPYFFSQHKLKSSDSGTAMRKGGSLGKGK